MKKLAENLPCINCILLPICRNTPRTFTMLYMECTLLAKYLEYRIMMDKNSYHKVQGEVNEYFNKPF